MQYIEQMDESDVTYFCKGLSSRTLRRLLKSNLTAMRKIKPDLVPDQMSDIQLVSFLVKNRNNDIIREFLNVWISYNLQMTEDTRNAMLKAGKNAEEAMAWALAKYMFRERVGLYYKLSSIDTTTDYIHLMEYAVRMVISSNNPEPSGIPTEWTLENQKAFEEWMSRLAAEYESQIAEAEKVKKDAKQSLEESRKELSKVKSQLMQAENGKSALQKSLNETKQELNDTRQALNDNKQKLEEATLQLEVSAQQLNEAKTALGEREKVIQEKEAALKNAKAPVKTETVVQSTDTTTQKTYRPGEGLLFMSLCRPYIDDRGQARLLRIADVNEKGEIMDEFEADAPQLFRLFQKDGPDDPHYVGVWDWKSVPNLYNPSKQYFYCSFHEQMEPIEIIMVPSVRSLEELVESLQQGIERVYTPDRMLCVYYNGACYEGVYLTYNQVVEQNGRITLNKEIQSLSVHRFMPSEITHVENVSYLRTIDPPPAVGSVSTRENMEIVKSIMLSKVLWPAMKDQGFGRADYKMIRDFVGAIPTSDVIERIARSCECSEAEAKRMADRFIENADHYIRDLTIGNEDAVRLIQNTPALMETCTEAALRKWEAQNTEKIQEAEAQLATLNGQILSNQTEIAQQTEKAKELEDQVRDYQDQVNVLEAKAREMEDQSRNLENQNRELETKRQSIEEEISKAQENMPEPESMAMPMPMGMPMGGFPHLMEPGFFEEMPWRNTNVMEHHSWSDVLIGIEIALLEAGVAQYALDGLAACMYAAYINRIPLLLTGPNSSDIVRAFSIAVQSKEPAVMRCGLEPAPMVIHRCRDSIADVIMVEQPLTTDWGGELFELLAQHRKFFLAVHPFAEDLRKAPRGLLNYFLPIMTELFVEKAPGEAYRGGMISNGFGELPCKPTTEHHDSLFRMLKMSVLTKNNLDRLLTDMHLLLETSQADSDYMFLLYPLAYMINELGALKESLGKAQTDSPVSIGIRNFLTPYLKDE